MLMRNMLLLAVAQGAFGTPGTPVPGTHAIQCRALAPSPINAETVKRTLLKGYKGNFGSFAVGEYRQLEIEIELGSSGAAGTAPRFAPLLIGCGAAETISAGVSAAYQPVNSGEPYYTLYCYLDGLRFSLEDAKFTSSFELNAKQIPVMKVTAIGKYVAMTDTALPGGAVFTNTADPLPVGKVNTPTFTIHGEAVKLTSFSLDWGNQLVWRDMPNFQGVVCNDRMPTARAVFELGAVASKNWPEIRRLSTSGALAIVHGVGAGKIVQIDAPAMVMNADPTLSEDQGITMVNTSWDLRPSSGNDEFVFTFK